MHSVISVPHRRRVAPAWTNMSVFKTRVLTKPPITLFFFVVYRVPATGNRSPRIAYRQSLWLADMWHAYWDVGSEPSRRQKSKWHRRSSDS